jgi:hypothetical protein
MNLYGPWPVPVFAQPPPFVVSRSKHTAACRSRLHAQHNLHRDVIMVLHMLLPQEPMLAAGVL